MNNYPYTPSITLCRSLCRQPLNGSHGAQLWHPKHPPVAGVRAREVKLEKGREKNDG